MNPLAHGRKFALTVLYLVLAGAVMAASFWLALAGKIGPEWVQVVNVFLVAAGAATGTFQAANAWITSKAPGLEPPRSPPAPPPET